MWISDSEEEGDTVVKDVLMILKEKLLFKMLDVIAFEEEEGC